MFNDRKSDLWRVFDGGRDSEVVRTIQLYGYIFTERSEIEANLG